MAITAPANFKCNKTQAAPGGILYFTWTKGTGDIEWYRIWADIPNDKYTEDFFPASASYGYVVIPSSGANAPNIGDKCNYRIVAGKGDQSYPEESASNYDFIQITIAAPTVPAAPTNFMYEFAYKNPVDGQIIYYEETQLDIGVTARFSFIKQANSNADFCGIVAKYKGSTYRRITNLESQDQYESKIHLDLVLNEVDPDTHVSIKSGGDLVVSAFTGTGDPDNPIKTVYAANTVTLNIIPSTEPEPPPAPPVAASGHLVQLENEQGENVYPKTVTEGVFRQSDGKPLEEILEAASGGVTMEQVNAAIQAAVLSSWGKSYG